MTVRTRPLPIRRKMLWATVAMATVGVGAMAAPASAKGAITYSFTFVNGKTVTGTATSNDTFIANAGGTDANNPTGMTVHVSCSDPFTGGFGVKQGPNKVTDSAWQIASYTIQKDSKKSCSGNFSPTPSPQGSNPAIDIEKFVNGDDADTPTGPMVQVGQNVTLTYVVKNTGNVSLRNVAVVSSTLGAIGCPKTVLAVGESMDCDTKTQPVTSAGQKSGLATVTGVADVIAPTTLPAPTGSKGIAYSFTFVNGKTVTGTATSNNTFIATAGGTDANNPTGMTVHVSCSDPFTGGFGVKEGPNRVSDSAWQIASYTIQKDSKKSCGETFSPVVRTVTDNDPVNYLAKSGPPAPLTGSIGDRAWFDTDGDGIQDDGENGLPFVGVTLLTPAGAQAVDASGAPVARQFTNAQGNYLFTGLAAGNYVVRFDTDCVFQATRSNVGTNDDNDSDAVPSGRAFDRCLATTGIIQLAAGGAITNVDFGVCYKAQPPTPIAKGSIGDRAWFDTDGDGIQDDGENGLPFVGVTLLTPSGAQAVDASGAPVLSKFTNAQGNYSFTGLAAGSYVVRFDTDCAFEPTADDAGSNDELDSDATAFGQAYGRCLAITRTIQLASGATVTNVDYGVVNATEPDPCRC